MPGVALIRISQCWLAATFPVTSLRVGISTTKFSNRQTENPPENASVQAIKIRLKLPEYRSRYRLRKQVVEPVFGPIK